MLVAFLLPMASLHISTSSGIIYKYMPYAFKSIYYIYSIPCLTMCLERGVGFSVTYGVTLLHTKEAYMHQWFYDIWESLSSQPFFTFVAIAIISFPVYILLGLILQAGVASTFLIVTHVMNLTNMYKM